MVFRLSKPTGSLGALRSSWAPLLAALLLAQSLTGNPGITGPVPGWTLALSGVALVLSALLVWLRGLRPFPWVSACVFLLSLLSWVSVANSPCVYLSNLSCASLAGFQAIVLLLEVGVRTREQWAATASALFLFCFVSALYGLILWRSGPAGEAFTSSFTNGDCYSVILFIGIFLGLALSVETGGPVRVLLVLGTLFMALVMPLTAARSGALATAAGYFAFLFTLASSRQARYRSVASRLFVLPGLLLLVFAAAGSQVPLFERLVRLSEGADHLTWQTRWDVIRHGYKTVLRSPLTGSGTGCFHLAYQQDRSALSAGEDYMNAAHNDYMQWLVETGILGGLLWIGLLLICLKQAWTSYRSPSSWVAGLIASVVAVGVYCLFNFACPVPADLLWLGACFGLCGSLARLNQPAGQSGTHPKLFPLAFCLAVWGLWAAQFGWKAVGVSRLEKRAQELRVQLDWEGAWEQLARACKLMPHQPNLNLESARVAQRLFVFSGDRKWLAHQEESLRKASASSPRDLRILLAVIRFLEETGRAGEATQYVDEAERQAPYSVYVTRARARNLIFKGELEAAGRVLERIERTGKASDDQALAVLIYALEKRQADQGSAFLRRVAAMAPERAASLGLMAAEASGQDKTFAVGLRLLKTLSYLTPGNPQVISKVAFLRGRSGDVVGELKLLNRLRDTEKFQLDDELSEKVWQRWAELEVDKGDLDLVLAELDNYLILRPRQLWARRTMAETFMRRFQNAEARRVLRAGISNDSDGSLRVYLADLCAQQGLYDLARGYYQDALKVSPQKAQIELRLKQLKPSAQDKEEDQIFDENVQSTK